MSITLELKPELEARAQARAEAQGLPVEEYLQAMLEQMLRPAPLPTAVSVSLDEFDAIMDALSEGSENEPVPPVLTRAEIYADHD